VVWLARHAHAQFLLPPLTLQLSGMARIISKRLDEVELRVQRAEQEAGRGMKKAIADELLEMARVRGVVSSCTGTNRVTLIYNPDPYLIHAC
jgi:hypothetical protein